MIAQPMLDASLIPELEVGEDDIDTLEGDPRLVHEADTVRPPRMDCCAECGGAVLAKKSSWLCVQTGEVYCGDLCAIRAGVL